MNEEVRNYFWKMAGIMLVMSIIGGFIGGMVSGCIIKHKVKHTLMKHHMKCFQHHMTQKRPMYQFVEEDFILIPKNSLQQKEKPSPFSGPMPEKMR